MNNDVRLLRRAAASLAVLGLLATGGCGAEATSNPPVASQTAPLSTSPTESIPLADAPADLTEADLDLESVFADPQPVDVGNSALEEGLAVFCTNTALAQQQASLSRPVLTPTDVQAFSRTVGEAWTAQTDRLETVTPPPELATPFAQFLDNARAMAAARATLARIPNNTTAADQIENLFLSRRPLATALGARRCDGQLPSTQQRAVVEATRTFVSSIDPTQGCEALVTTTFVETQFYDTPDPQRSCAVEVLRLADNPSLRSHDITATNITGTEGISATVEFTENDGCCAGVPTVARLYYIGGQWKIHSMDYS